MHSFLKYALRSCIILLCIQSVTQPNPPLPLVSAVAKKIDGRAISRTLTMSHIPNSIKNFFKHMKAFGSYTIETAVPPLGWIAILGLSVGAGYGVGNFQRYNSIAHKEESDKILVNALDLLAFSGSVSLQHWTLEHCFKAPLDIKNTALILSIPCYLFGRAYGMHGRIDRASSANPGIAESELYRASKPFVPIALLYLVMQRLPCMKALVHDLSKIMNIFSVMKLYTVIVPDR